MKKIVSSLLVLILCLTLVGCGEKKYVEGTYEGSAVDDYGGQDNTATAKVTVDDEGKITSVYLDTTYTPEGGVATTKKALGADYGMFNHPYGSKIGEWYQQVEALEKFVVEKQGIDELNLDEKGHTDAVSGCTIKIDALYKALEDALNKAKK